MEWINLKLQKPTKETPVLAFWKEDKIEGAILTDLDGEEYWYYLQDGDVCSKNPTHWMYLPKSPL